MFSVICLILIIVAAIFGVVMSFLYWRLPATFYNRLTAAALTVMTLLVCGALAILLLVPSVTQHADAIGVKAAEIRTLTRALGGTENYIEYLKAIKE